MQDFTTADGATIEYERSGNGAPMLLIHGALLGRAFEHVAKEPALAEFEVIRIHRRGHCGSSPAVPPFGVADQARDGIALLDQLQIDSAHIVGHSFGAIVALQLALDAPERTKSLTLLEAPYVDAAEPPPDPVLAAVGKFQQGDRAGAVDGFGRFAIGEDYAGRMEAAMPGAFDDATRDVGAFFTTELQALLEWELLPDAQRTLGGLPVLLAVSADAEPVYLAAQKLLADAVPDLRVEALAWKGHMFPLEDPPGTAAAIAGNAGPC